MSLLEQAYEDYAIIDNTTVDDGMGGYEDVWKDGATIKGAMVFNSSIEGRKAEAMGVSSVYTLTTKKNVVLKYHQVLRRESDKKIFRVTSDGDDSFTPNGAGLNMRQVTCEEWKLTGEVTNDKDGSAT